MPNPTTIEELLKMKPCPFEHEQLITIDLLWEMVIARKVDARLYELITNTDGWDWYKDTGFGFEMPEGYYYLPIGMNLGLPEGEWTYAELEDLINSLPFGVVNQYFNDASIGYVIYKKTQYYDEKIVPLDGLEFTRISNPKTKIIYIVKQPSPNLYNPLDHKEEVLMENNSANEELRYQLKCPPKFTPFNPNFFERKFTLDELKALNFQPASCGIMPMSKIDEITNYIGVCFSDQTWGLSEEGITYLNDQITQIIHDHHQPEAEPVKEQPTPTELPWQDISTFNDLYKGWYVGWRTFNDGSSCALTFHSKRSNTNGLTHWLPITPPKALTVEAPPVEPERVSYSWFAIEPEGTWYCLDYESGYQLFTHLTTYEATSNLIREVIANGYPIYATEPSAWLAWKAEQEGKSV